MGVNNRGYLSSELVSRAKITYTTETVNGKAKREAISFLSAANERRRTRR